MTSFFQINQTKIELLEATKPDSAIAKFIEKKGEGIHHIAFEVDNIESRPLWKPMHLQPIFENYPYYGRNIAEQLFENGLCLPSGSNLTDEDRNRIVQSINLLF